MCLGSNQVMHTKQVELAGVIVLAGPDEEDFEPPKWLVCFALCAFCGAAYFRA